MVCDRRTVSLQPYLLDDSCVSAERRKPRIVTDWKRLLVDLVLQMVVLRRGVASYPGLAEVLQVQHCWQVSLAGELCLNCRLSGFWLALPTGSDA